MNNNSILKVTFKSVPFVIVLTIMALFVYVAVQQEYRQNANDPQIQMAEDAASAIGTGKTAQGLTSQALDISQSLAPFMILYDTNKKAFQSFVTLNNETPAPPSGVFDTAKKKGEDRLTWQPANNTRIAAVVVPINGGSNGYVLAGRNLREVEQREQQLSTGVFLAWIIGVVLVIGWFGFKEWQTKALPKV